MWRTEKETKPYQDQEFAVPDSEPYSIIGRRSISPISSIAKGRERLGLGLGPGRIAALGVLALALVAGPVYLSQQIADSGRRPPVIDAFAVSARPIDELQTYLQDSKPAIDHTWTAVVLRPVTLIAWVKAEEGVNLRSFPSTGVDKDGVLPVNTPLGPQDTFVIERNEKGQDTAVWVPVETDQGRKFSAAAFCLEEKPQQLMDFRNQVTGQTLSFEEFLNWIGVSITSPNEQRGNLPHYIQDLRSYSSNEAVKPK